jgi:Arc/MetJ-type ribon-helix-helix transcriptional regulator
MRDEYDFSDGQRGPIINTRKERLTIRLDPEVIQWFREQVKDGGNYQTLMNDALLGHIQRQTNADVAALHYLREKVREGIESGHGIEAEAVFARLEAKYRLTCEALEDVDAGRTIDHEAVQAAVQALDAATVEMPEAAARGEAATGGNNA